MFLAHDRIEGQPVGIADVLIARKMPINRLPEQAIEPVYRVLALAAVAQCPRRKAGPPRCVIRLAHHQQAAVGTELRAPELQPHPSVEFNPITPLGTRTLRVTREIRPKSLSTP